VFYSSYFFALWFLLIDEKKNSNCLFWLWSKCETLWHYSFAHQRKKEWNLIDCLDLALCLPITHFKPSFLVNDPQLLHGICMRDKIGGAVQLVTSSICTCRCAWRCDQYWKGTKCGMWRDALVRGNRCRVVDCIQKLAVLYTSIPILNLQEKSHFYRVLWEEYLRLKFIKSSIAGETKPFLITIIVRLKWNFPLNGKATMRFFFAARSFLIRIWNVECGSWIYIPLGFALARDYFRKLLLSRNISIAPCGSR